MAVLPRGLGTGLVVWGYLAALSVGFVRYYSFRHILWLELSLRRRR
jgi:hypothetical protein